MTESLTDSARLALLTDIMRFAQTDAGLAPFLRVTIERIETALDATLLLWTPDAVFHGARLQLVASQKAAVNHAVHESVNLEQPWLDSHSAPATALRALLQTSLGIKTATFVPLGNAPMLRGLLVIGRDNPLADTDRFFVQTIVGLLDQIIERAQTRRAHAQQQMVLESVALLTEPHNIQAALRHVLKQVCDLVGAAQALFYRLDPGARSLQRVASVGAATDTAFASVSFVDVPELRSALRLNTAQWVQPVKGSVRSLTALTRAGIRAELVVSARVGQKDVGALIVRFTHTNRPPDTALQSIQTIATHIAIALERAATTDDLATPPSSLIGLLDLAPVGIAIWHIGGTLSLNNAVANQMYDYQLRPGMTLPEFMTLCDMQVAHPDGRPLTLAENPVLYALRNTTPDPMLLKIRSSIGAREIMMVSSRVQDGKSIIVISYDVTDVHEALRQTTRANAEIEVLQAANDRKSDFMAMVAHDVRNPLAVIMGVTDVLLLSGERPTQPIEAATMIMEQCRRIKQLVDEYLDLARIEAGAEEFDMKDVPIAVLILDASSVVNDRQHSLQFSGLDVPMVRTDRAKATRVLENLLSNAAKYSADGAPIVVEGEHIGDEVEIRVRDKGVGIPPERQLYIFTKFYRAATTNQPGTGLGLAISRELLLHLGGSIGFESTFGEGSTFWIRLPIAKDRF